MLTPTPSSDLSTPFHFSPVFIKLTKHHSTPKQKLSKFPKKEVNWGSRLPPGTSDRRPYCWVLEHLNAGGGQVKVASQAKAIL